MIRGCGYRNECGVIWYSLLMRQGSSQETIERLMEYHILRSVMRMSAFDRQIHYVWHESLYAVVGCRCSRYVRLKTGPRILMNVILRLQSRLPLSDADKEEMLHVVSRRLFYAQESLVKKYKPWIVKKLKTDFKFVQTGVLLEDVTCMKLALKTMSYEVSVTAVPRHLPFLPHPILFLGACRSNIVATISLRTCTKGSPVTQPVITRSMIREMADPAVWPIASSGLCYLPVFRTATYMDVEEWILHIHGTFCDHHPEDPCEGCQLRQPLPLQYIAQMCYLRNCITKRRARVEWDRKSCFFFIN